MKSLSLDLNERQHCSLILSSQQAGPTDVMVLSKIFEKVKLTRSDELIIGLNVQNGAVSWTMPEGQPLLSVDLEDEEARKLKTVLNSWTNYSLRDATWVADLLKKLD
jgi:hypothetical protein